MSNLKTVTHDFPLPDSSTAIVFDFFEMLHRQALTGTNELIRNYVQQSIVNGRPDNSLCLSRDAKFMLSPVFYTSEPGTKRKRLPAAGDVLKATSFINFVGRSYYQNQTIFSYAERKEDKARGRWDPESFEPGEVIAAATLGFVFVTTTESGGWKASKCPEELVEGGWVVSSPLNNDPMFSFITRDEPPISSFLNSPSSTRLPSGSWTARFTDSDSFGHVNAPRRSYPFFEYLYQHFPNFNRRENENPRGIPVAPNSVVGYFIDFRTEIKASEECAIEGVLLPGPEGSGLVEARFTLEGDETRGLLNRATFLIIGDGVAAAAGDLVKAVPRTGKGRVLLHSAL